MQRELFRFSNQSNFRIMLRRSLAKLVLLLLVAVAAAQTQPAQKQSMTNHATGPFDVRITAQEDKPAEPQLNRMTLDKQYRGDMQGTGKGQMLTASTDVKGSGAYVAIERFTGTLKGVSGSFVLQHSGTMVQNAPHLTITVVPDSGTEDLKGITGKMTINIAADGSHTYEFEYTLPQQN